MTLRSWAILIAAAVTLEALLLAALWRLPAAYTDVLLLAFALVAMAAAGFVAVGILSGQRWAFFTFLAAVLFLVNASFRFGGGGSLEADWQTVLKVSVYALGAVLSAIMLKHAVPLLRGPTSLVTGFAAVTLVSTLYSPVPFFTLYASMTMVALTVIATAVPQYLSERDVLTCLMIATGLHMLLALALLALAPSLVLEYWSMQGSDTARLIGATRHANMLGRLACLYILSLVILHLTHGWQRGIVTLLALPGVLVLILTWSRTAWVALTLTLLALLVRRHVVLILLVAVTGALLALVTSGLDTGVTLSDLAARVARTGDPSEIFTATGRTSIWQNALAAVTERPLFGTGYGASRVALPGGIGHSHNLVLELLVGTGFLGAAFLLPLLAWQAVQFYRHPHLFRDAMFVFAVVVGLTESSIAGPVPTLLTFAWLLSLFSWAAHEHAASEPAPTRV